jgi:16S rRNA (uracil1498-N3)-methyltransferase
MADRFFVDGPISLGEIALTGEEAHHLANVRRFAEGDSVVLFNGDGNCYLGTVLSVAKRHVMLDVTSVEESRSELASPCWIASALPKGDRFDFLLEKLTELGVTDFVPLRTERSVVIPKEEKRDKWRRAVIEASKQCGRDRLMRVHSPHSFRELLSREDLPSRRQIAHPSGNRMSRGRDERGILYAVGPEGGFTEEEVATAAERGWEKVSLGPRILRIETAAIALASVATISGATVES